ncbi:MAG TPA: glycosyltransferase family A protein, partial [Rhodospirillales bacterium]|nr:glycosyltransferase family A protein [Rhodospirillales bacterium]
MALAPHAPNVALALLSRRHGGFRAALYARIGQRAAAGACLAGTRGSGANELLLSATLSLDDGNPDTHLAQLNRALAAFRLEPVVRRDDGAPFTLHNLTGTDVAPVDGPLVSVIMPARNTERYIDTALSGLASQSWRNLEIIVVDDASEDGTSDRVRAWADREPRIRLIRAASAGGPYCAKNLALQLARGQFVTFHDSDDWSHPRRVERHVLPLLADPKLCATTS